MQSRSRVMVSTAGAVGASLYAAGSLALTWIVALYEFPSDLIYHQRAGYTWETIDHRVLAASIATVLVAVVLGALEFAIQRALSLRTGFLFAGLLLVAGVGSIVVTYSAYFETWVKT